MFHATEQVSEEINTFIRQYGVGVREEQQISDHQYKLLRFICSLHYLYMHFSDLKEPVSSKGKQMDWFLGKFVLHNVKVNISFQMATTKIFQSC